MIALPKSTEFNKKLPKQKFYENLAISRSIKKLFVDQIKAIYWQNKLSEDTLDLSAGDAVTEIEFIRVVLNQGDIDEAVLKLLDQGIPYHIVFILEFNDKIRLCSTYKKCGITGVCNFESEYYYTEWLTEDSVQLKIVGLSLDSVYEGFVRQIAKDKILIESDNIKNDIEATLRIEKIKREIDRTEKLARKEKQPKKKFELADRVKVLKNELYYFEH